jgi:hypothetical protein
MAIVRAPWLDGEDEGRPSAVNAPLPRVREVELHVGRSPS